MVLLTFPLAAGFTFLLARRLGSGRPGAAVAALAYAFAPFHVAHAAYHPHVAQVQWLPLYLLALWSCLECWTAGRALLLLAALALLSLSNDYAGLHAVLLTPVALFAYRGRRRPGGDGRPFGLAHRGDATGGAGGGGGRPAGAGSRGAALPERFAFPAADLVRYSARWWSYLLPPVDHPLLGAVARAVWARHPVGDGLVEQQVGLGLALPALAVAAWGPAAAGHLAGAGGPGGPGRGRLHPVAAAAAGPGWLAGSGRRRCCTGWLRCSAPTPAPRSSSSWRWP